MERIIQKENVENKIKIKKSIIALYLSSLSLPVYLDTAQQLRNPVPIRYLYKNDIPNPSDWLLYSQSLIPVVFQFPLIVMPSPSLCLHISDTYIPPRVEARQPEVPNYHPCLIVQDSQTDVSKVKSCGCADSYCVKNAPAWIPRSLS